jgi:hypothetical protein
MMPVVAEVGEDRARTDAALEFGKTIAGTEVAGSPQKRSIDDRENLEAVAPTSPTNMLRKTLTAVPQKRMWNKKAQVVAEGGHWVQPEPDDHSRVAK